jgi:hypothetical protein
VLLETVNQMQYNKKGMKNTIQITKYMWNAGLDNQVHKECRVILNNEKDSFIQVHEHKAELNLNKIQNKKMDEKSDNSSKRRL